MIPGPVGDRAEAAADVRIERILDRGSLAVRSDDPRLAQDAQMVGDRGLADAARRREVAGADGRGLAELAHDRQPGGIGESVEEPYVGVEVGRRSSHRRKDIVVCLY